MAAGSQVLIRELVVVIRMIPLHHYMPYIDFGAGGLSFSDIRGPNHLLILRISLIRLTLFRPVVYSFNWGTCAPVVLYFSLYILFCLFSV